MKRLAVITTHPIQYHAPWFRLLAGRKRISIKVFYTWSQTEHEEKFDPGFGKVIEWDVPLLDEYDYAFVPNVAKRPGSKSFRGIENPSLIKNVEAWNPDAVLVFGWKFKSHLSAIRYFKNKIPVLFRGDSTLLDPIPLWKKWLRRSTLSTVFRNIDYALYVGTANKNYFLQNGLRERRLVYVPHAVDIDRFRSEGDSMRFRRMLEIKENEIVFLFAGKLELKKNPTLLASSFLASKLRDAHLVFVGNGALEDELRSRFSSSNIHFLDFQNQRSMPDVYKMADVFVLSSQGPGETWGLAVNEAMAAGKPVLVSDKCGCAADLVVEGKTGYTFRSGNVDDLRRKIELMIHQKNELEEMGENASRKIQDSSFDQIVKTIEDLIIEKC